jgi:multisubunit Na+/H+ antiporter MnhE subunit
MRIVYWAAEAALLFVLWLLFVAQLASHELLVGAGATVLAASATEAVRGCEHPRFLPHIQWIIRSWRLPFEILRDCALLIRNLFDGRTGHLEALPFDAQGDDARAVARRALAIFYTTLPPNTVVIGIDRRRNVMLLHRLEGIS